MEEGVKSVTLALFNSKGYHEYTKYLTGLNMLVQAVIKEVFGYEAQSEIATYTDQDLGHGRIVKRTCRVINNVD